MIFGSEREEGEERGAGLMFNFGLFSTLRFHCMSLSVPLFFKQEIKAY